MLHPLNSKILSLARFCLTAAALLYAPGYAHADTITFEAACKPGDRVTVAVAGDLLFHRKLQVQAYSKDASFKRSLPTAERKTSKSAASTGNNPQNTTG